MDGKNLNLLKVQKLQDLIKQYKINIYQAQFELLNKKGVIN